MDREDFMDIVYSELHSDGDNNRANRIIEAADEYASTHAEITFCKYCTYRRICKWKRNGATYCSLAERIPDERSN